MNEQLLPIDDELGAQLARRASGKMPDGLLADVIQAVDSAQDRPNTWHLPRTGTRSPQFALSALSGIFASILIAVLMIAPFMQWQTAGSAYPADRALSTPELANLMSGPALAMNAAIVASATIDADPNACPMDRYQTLGVVEAMGSQVCVMSAGTYTGLAGSKWTGVWAFRFIAPGILGLLGQVDPASAVKLAYDATDQWPLAGNVFLVNGWLGSDGLCEVSKWIDPEPGEVLNPTGSEPCAQSWISDKESPDVFKNAAANHSAPAESKSGDTVAQIEDVYWVGAGGMRYYDDVPGKYNPPVHGTWAVKSAVGPCPNDPPTSSRGCGFWLVLARVTDLTTSVAPSTSPPESTSSAAPVTPIPEPTTPAPPTPLPLTGLPVQRAMTTAEFAALMAGPAPAVGTTFVATVTVDEMGCKTAGLLANAVIERMSPQVCVGGGSLVLPKITGTFAFRYVSPGLVQNLGQVEPASSCKLLRSPTDAWPGGITEYHTFLVGGYLVRQSAGWMILSDPGAPAPTVGPGFRTVLIDTDAGFDSIDRSRYGVFVVAAEWTGGSSSTTLPNGDHQDLTWDGWAYHVRALVAGTSGPSAVPSAPASVCGPAPSIPR